MCTKSDVIFLSSDRAESILSTYCCWHITEHNDSLLAGAGHWSHLQTDHQPTEHLADRSLHEPLHQLPVWRLSVHLPQDPHAGTQYTPTGYNTGGWLAGWVGGWVGAQRYCTCLLWWINYTCYRCCGNPGTSRLHVFTQAVIYYKLSSVAR